MTAVAGANRDKLPHMPTRHIARFCCLCPVLWLIDTALWKMKKLLGVERAAADDDGASRWTDYVFTYTPAPAHTTNTATQTDTAPTTTTWAVAWQGRFRPPNTSNRLD